MSSDTLDVILRELPKKPACELEALLYNAGIDILRGLLARKPTSAKILLIVGHNPGLGEFARFSCGAGKAPPPFPAAIARLVPQNPAEGTPAVPSSGAPARPAPRRMFFRFENASPDYNSGFI